MVAANRHLCMLVACLILDATIALIVQVSDLNLLSTEQKQQKQPQTHPTDTNAPHVDDDLTASMEDGLLKNDSKEDGRINSDLNLLSTEQKQPQTRPTDTNAQHVDDDPTASMDDGLLKNYSKEAGRINGDVRCYLKDGRKHLFEKETDLIGDADELTIGPCSYAYPVRYPPAKGYRNDVDYFFFRDTHKDRE
jgi:hypothetical protein